jgi:hypothetical protein
LILGVPNGIGANQAAVLHLGVPSVISRSFARRAIKLLGRLTDSVGEPISDAELELFAVPTSAGAPRELIARTTTQGDGSFELSVPTGPSRTLEVTYRAFSTTATYAATATVRENVGAGVILHVSPPRTTPTGKIELRGQVLGQIPKGGVLIELLVHYRGEWVPFRDPQTGRHGRFHVKYHFEGGRGVFPFRAQVRGGQQGFPYTLGYSNSSRVHT